MKLSFLFFGDKPDEKWQLCRQMGIRYAIAKLSSEHTGKSRPWEFDTMKKSYQTFGENGFELIGFEGDQFDMDRIKFGLPGREEDIENYQTMLRNMGQLGIRLLCYNFMAGIGWYRTHKALEERGGAKVSGFRYADVPEFISKETIPITEKKLWINYEWFLKKVLPVAEEAGVKMALHPDDPPVSPLGNIARIFTSAEAIRKALLLSDSPSHGLTFCQGTYTTMGEDIKNLVEEFSHSGKIFFIHVRDVKGHRHDFRETFHDNGPTDMVKTFKAYKKAGIDVPLRSDHVPAMYGEEGEKTGYGMKGNLFGIGYIKGIMDSVEINYQ